MTKRYLTQEEREDIRVVMEATQRLLPYYEKLSAAETLNEQEQYMLEQIRQTLQDVLEYSGIMINQIQLLQLENPIDIMSALPKPTLKNDWETFSSHPDMYFSYVEFLKDSINEQLN